MEIRLTVLAPPAGHGTGRMCDVLVTAPAGTALAAVAPGLATAVLGPDASASAAVYAGTERLDPHRSALGEPPLLDGAVLSLQVPGEDGGLTDEAAAQLRVVAGPDAGGVHLLHGGRIRIGRSAEADVPLDDPDVSRLHCAVTVSADGQVSVADLGSTNGTTVSGAPIGEQPVPLPPGALLRLGESSLVVTASGAAPTLPAAPDGEGRLRVAPAGAPAPPAGGAVSPAGPAAHDYAPGGSAVTHGHGADLRRLVASTPRLPDPRIPDQRAGGSTATAPGAAHGGTHRPAERAEGSTHDRATGAREGEGAQQHGPHSPDDAEAPARGAGPRRRGGIGAWARRISGTRGVEEAQPAGTADYEPATPHPADDGRPDPAELLLTALGPGPRLWERDRPHPLFLTVRVGTEDAAGRAGGPSAPVTVDLAQARSLGLAGPRERLLGLARSVVAQLAALHSPTGLEIVLISTDRARGEKQRVREWSWLGWLPHVRPAQGQDCRLLLAFDREQASARAGELTRRLEGGPLGSGWASADPAEVADVASRHTGPRALLIVDGDPGSAALREATARLAAAGTAGGVHVLCLSETHAASALSPVAATYETACALSLPFRECGAVALLSGDVATALRLLTLAPGRPLGEGRGTVAVVDAVSPAWAERFARALAPLRSAAQGAAAPGRAVPVPRSARLLDELGLARATPASLMARWASASEATDECAAVLGAGPHGPVAVDLGRDATHLLVEGPAGSGRTELLRAAAASLAAAGRPDRLGLLLVEGSAGSVRSSGGTGAGSAEGLAACTELPHVTEHLVATDPVRMRSFAQALGAELKRRAETLGTLDFAEWHASRAVAERMVGQRGPSDEYGEVAPTATLQLRPGLARAVEQAAGPVCLPRLVVLVDDLDALLAPALGSPGRPAAGSVVRALEAVAREGARLGVHLIAATAPGRADDTELARRARLRVLLDAAPASPGPEDPLPGRGRLTLPDGRPVVFQAGRVTGRIPRTGTLRPTVAPLDWARMGDPPARRPVRELGNGPTDLALLASALERAARSVAATPVAPLTPAHG